MRIINCISKLKIIKILDITNLRYGRPFEVNIFSNQVNFVSYFRSPHLCNRMSTNASVSEYKREMETFQDVYPNVIQILSKNPGLYNNPDVTNWLKKVIISYVDFL